MLGRADRLYGLTAARDERTLWYEPAPRPNEEVMPSDRREVWTPKAEAPQPNLRVETRPTVAQWSANQRHEHALVQALFAQRFRNIEVSTDTAYRLNLSVENENVRPISRAIGRAVRTALKFAPLETREIRVTFRERGAPLVVYEFISAEKLQAYLSGSLGREAFAETVSVRYIDPGVREADPLAKFGDLDTIDDTPKLTQLLPEGHEVKRVAGDVRRAAQTASDANWWRFAGLGAGALIGGAFLDKRAFEFASDHSDSRALRGVRNVGNAVPWLGLGAAALAALDKTDPRRSRTGYAAVEAGGVAFLAATGLKYAFGRARPEAGLGRTDFQFGSTDSSRGSFPSRHAALAWAVATPFAREYDAEWLYGVAALSNLGRIAGRSHWVSDTVAGSLLGYAIGRIFWESARKPQTQGVPRVLLSPTGVNLAWDLE